MSRATTFFRHECQHTVLRQTGGLRRCEVAGDNNLLTGRHRRMGRPRPQQMVHHAAGDIADVRSTLTEEVILHALKDIDVALDDFLKAELDVEAGGTNFLTHVVDKRDVIEDQEMCVEDGGLRFTQTLGDFLPELGDRLARGL